MPINSVINQPHPSPWQSLPSYPGPARHHPITFSNSTHGFLLTGSVLTLLKHGRKRYTLKNSNDFYIYSENENTWHETAKFPGKPRSFAYGIAMEGTNYAYMGFGATNLGYLNDFWRYDMNSNEWKELSSCPGYGRKHPTMVAAPIDGKIYVGLGNGKNEASGKWENFADFWEYDTDSDSWTQIDDLPAIGRHHPFFFNINNTVYTGMGHSSKGIERDWFKLDGRSWVKLADFSSDGTTEARVAGTEFNIPECNMGFVLSGDGDNHGTMDTGEFHGYVPEEDKWIAFPPHPGVSRWAPGSFVIGKNVYFTSGVNRMTWEVLDDFWKIDMSEYC